MEKNYSNNTKKNFEETAQKLKSNPSKGCQPTTAHACFPLYHQMDGKMQHEVCPGTGVTAGRSKWVACPSSLCPCCPSQSGFHQHSCSLFAWCCHQKWHCNCSVKSNHSVLTSERGLHISMSEPCSLWDQTVKEYPPADWWKARGVLKEQSLVWPELDLIAVPPSSPKHWFSSSPSDLTWCSNSAVHKRCVVLITVHRNLFRAGLGPIHWGYPATSFIISSQF